MSRRGENHRVIRQIGEKIHRETQATGENHQATQGNGENLEMKTERTRDLQMNRVDNQKANKPIFVQKGERPTARDGELLDDTVGLFIRRNGQWRQIGLSTGQVAEVADEQIAAAPVASRVDNIDVSQVVAGQERTEYKQYEQGNPPGNTFVLKSYASLSDRNLDIELPEDEQPTDISFDPSTPEQESGTHAVSVTFTPVDRDGLTFVEIYIE